MKLKLEDVAKLAQVSKTTVSRVLNNRGYISDETKDKVYQAMTTLNYQPNSAARQLYNQKTNIVGLLFPTVSNPFFGELVLELERKLYDLGYIVIIGNSMNDCDKETHYINQLLSNQLDGLIVGTHNIGIEQYNNRNLSIVAIDRVVNEDIPDIRSDNFEGGVLATQHLIDRGAKHIIHTNGPIDVNTTANLRQSGYEDTMKQHGLTPITYTINFELSFDEKAKKFRQIFEEHPEVDGIFASNDTDAIQIYNMAATYNKRVPEDLKIIGYDGTELMRHMHPELTTIIQPINSIAQQAVNALEQRINNEETEQHTILPVELWQGSTS
ncbi:LacI family DNA-binding transcriptional regulator [Staphylococcus pasteuri]|uniref:LacI family DNA-binding transcriptional regulator n=1 Tax=Staphylococcus pasteuri TaxID=45972 RepID=UPI000E366D6E|nr:LacI family DNA-binding transcriptional regulator [Staphylococcus pasteuri]RFD67066.1 LacI family transcriptional regulator [Staphylococcus pasteuri]